MRLYIRGHKTAPFRVRMERGRSVFRSEKLRALARGASLLLVLLLSLTAAGGCFAQDQPPPDEFTPLHPESPSLQAGDEWQVKSESTGKPRPLGRGVTGFTYDFGQVKQGSVQKHAFILKNETAKALAIKDTNSSCGCTTSAVKKKVLLPGESAEIEVKFNSKGYSGAVQQFVYVSTDSLDNPVVKYIIKAEVIK